MTLNKVLCDTNCSVDANWRGAEDDLHRVLATFLRDNLATRRLELSALARQPHRWFKREAASKLPFQTDAAPVA